MDTNNFSRHLTMDEVKINDDFWNKIIDLVKEEVIPYQYLALQDKIEGAEKSYCIENFKKAKTVKDKINKGIESKKYPVDKWQYDESNSAPEAFKGWVFQDSDVYKWLEAVGYSLQSRPDADLESKAKKYVDIICDAQLDNGYLDTLYIINDIDMAFTNLRDMHELYCFGHLAEAGVSFYHATGEKKLLNAAYRFANLICDTFGEDKIRGYGGHEIAEMALYKLYAESGNRKYLDTAMYLVSERGKKPYYFDIEQGKKTINDNYFYNQAHCEPIKQTEAVGHAVRGVYLYSAMADLAKESNNDSLANACKKIWDNIENKKLYITGGIGATVDGEAFSFDYDLPNDLAYCETCASIGLIFFARRMSELEINSHYAEVAERALYNTVLSGMAEDGKSFFYVNPLEVLPEASQKDSRKRHIKPIRQKWFSCACCPPNLARLICSLNEYIYTVNDNTIFINLFIGSDAKTDFGNVTLIGNDGKYKVKITEFKKPFRVAVRIPQWCNSNYKAEKGYTYFDITGNTEIEIDFKVDTTVIKCSNLVRANTDKVAITRGPFVYCLEEADNGKNLQMLKIDLSKPFEYKDGVIYAKGFREKPDNRLYSPYFESEKEECTLKFIPYYKWGNRGINEMCVYVRK